MPRSLAAFLASHRLIDGLFEIASAGIAATTSAAGTIRRAASVGVARCAIIKTTAWISAQRAVATWLAWCSTTRATFGWAVKTVGGALWVIHAIAIHFAAWFAAYAVAGSIGTASKR